MGGLVHGHLLHTHAGRTAMGRHIPVTRRGVLARDVRLERLQKPTSSNRDFNSGEKMKNAGLAQDFANIRVWENREAIDEAIRYIEFLEGKEDRLTKLEDRLNSVESSDIPNKDLFLKQFEEFKGA
jgi:hypothetical protein